MNNLTRVDLEKSFKIKIDCPCDTLPEKIITLAKLVRAHHDCRPKIDIADAKYDNTDNYSFLRANGSIPIIDYNARRENLTAEALRERGYEMMFMKYRETQDPDIAKKLQPFEVPNAIRNIIQRE